MTRWEARRERWKNRRDAKRWLQGSSLEGLFQVCRLHGIQAVEPYDDTHLVCGCPRQRL